MTWTALTYAFGSTLTSTKMTQNQDNFTAVAEGHSGAPRIQQAALGTGGDLGTWALISKQTISASVASVTFTGIPNYPQYILLLENILAAANTANNSLRLRVGSGSVDTGANYHFAGELIGSNVTGTSLAEVLASQTSIPLAQYAGAMTARHDAGPGTCGIVYFLNPRTAQHKIIHTGVSWRNSGTAETADSRYTGAWANTGTLDQVNIFYSATNIGSGVFRLYGVSTTTA